MTQNSHDNLVGNWQYMVSLGNADRASHWNKFGSNSGVSTTEEDIWSYGGTQTLLTTGTTLLISCSDNTNGQGQVIRVVGLDANWDQNTVDVTLVGTTPVQIGLTDNWTRIHRAYQVSASPDPVGDVYIAEADTYAVAGVPDTASKVHGVIDYTDAAAQTDMANFTVPAGYKAVVHRFQGGMRNASAGSARTAEINISISELAEGASVAAPAWAPRRKVTSLTVSTNNNTATTKFDFPLVYPELTNIHARAVATATSIIVAEFDLLLLPTT